ncbi:hypothetical protein B0H13DRAFT_2350762 [Mycena leptocephala]|nr:hypothetical protein B0H13DRAFT_2350762 [Mycena leptocephala]
MSALYGSISPLEYEDKEKALTLGDGDTRVVVGGCRWDVAGLEGEQLFLFILGVERVGYGEPFTSHAAGASAHAHTEGVPMPVSVVDAADIV